MTLTVHIYELTNSSLLLDATQSEKDDVLATQKRIWALTAKLKKTNEFYDLVPGMNSLTLYLKSANELGKWRNLLPSLWENTAAVSFTGNHHTLKTTYQGEDLHFVAQTNNLTTEQVITLHSQATYHVLFLGFQPGFAYLHGLDPRLHIPRRAIPRIKIPKGSIALGADKTAIYPAESPGGWHIIGHTNQTLFDFNNKRPCLFQPGDTLSFVAINTEQGA